MPTKDSHSFIPTEGHAEFGDMDTAEYRDPDTKPKKPTMTGFEAYLKDGFSKIGEPEVGDSQATKQQYKIVGSGAGRIRPVRTTPINPNARIISKSRKPVKSIYTSGKNKGKTKEQVIADARKFYNSQSQSYKDAWANKGNEGRKNNNGMKRL